MLIWRADKALLVSAFLLDVVNLLEPRPETWYVLEGFRSLARSQVLYDAYLKGGPRAAPPGKSAHNYGLAIDVVLRDPVSGKPTWNIKLQQWVTLKLLCLNHPRLTHGSSFGDWPHVERYHWQQFIPKAP